MLIKSALFLVGLTAMGQTLVDLRTQGKSVDFTSAPSTKPLKSGAVMPPTCDTGEMFLKTNALPGSNVFACLSANTWVLQLGGNSGGIGVTVNNDGVPLGQRQTLNYVPGQALLSVVTDTGSQINIQHNLDTAVVLTQGQAQAGTALLCAPASASGSAYSCALTPTLTALSTNMVLEWRPDVNGTGGATTLNIDTLGAKAVKLADGATNPAAGDILANRLYPIWYDGTSFRLQISPALIGSTASRPTCDVAARGRLWQTFETTGVKDTVAVCARDASSVYAWRTIY